MTKKRHRQSLERRAKKPCDQVHFEDCYQELRETVAAKKFDDARALLVDMYKSLDQAASKKIIHVNKAARTKSRLNHLIAKASREGAAS